jgi:hypothetical protein
LIASGLDESIGGAAKTIEGRFVNLFDSELRVQKRVTVSPASRILLRDLDDATGGGEQVLASACKVIPAGINKYAVEGIANTQGIVLLRAEKQPARVTLDGKEVLTVEFSATDKLCWIKFPNEARSRELSIVF